MTSAEREEAIIGSLLSFICKLAAAAVLAGGLWYFI